MNNNRESTERKAPSGTAEADANRPAFTAGIWNRRKIRGGTFLSNSDLFRLIEKGEALPRIEYLHEPKLYAVAHDGQPEPAEAIPADVPRAILKTVKARKTGKAPTSQIYLPIEYAGRDVLVIALNPETAYLIHSAEARRNAQEILNEYPDDDQINAKNMCLEMIDAYISETSGADIESALPDDLKKGSAARSKFIGSYTFTDGTTIRAPPALIEKIKQNPEKYYIEMKEKINKTKKVKK